MNIIPKMRMEWELSFNFILHDHVTGPPYKSVMLFTTKTHAQNRLPGIWINPDGRLMVVHKVDNGIQRGIHLPIVMHRENQVKVTMNKLPVVNEFLFTIYLNNIVKHETEIPENLLREYSNVNVFIGDPHHFPAHGVVKNLKYKQVSNSSI